MFRGRCRAIYVHGCFWHRHPDPACKLAGLPKFHRDFWLLKLEGNRARDLRNQRLLHDKGWSYLLVWECELVDPRVLVDRLQTFLVLGKGAC